jgi:hypothetical protein
MCGQLHCSPAVELSYFASTLLYSQIASVYKVGKNTYYCNSTIIDVGMQLPDPGMAPDGAKCDEGKMCLSQKCVEVASLSVPSCPKNCSNHGVCNNLGECDCDKGYGTPDCSHSGCGGSIHGGSPKYGCVNNVETASRSGLTAGLCVLFLVILPLLAIATFLGIRYREQIRSVWSSTFQRQSTSRVNEREMNENVTADSTSNNNNNNKRKVKPTRAAPRQPQQPTAPGPYVINVSDGAGGHPAALNRAPRPPPPVKPSKPVKESPEQLDPQQSRVQLVILPAGARPTLPPKPAPV